MPSKSTTSCSFTFCDDMSGLMVLISERNSRSAQTVSIDTKKSTFITGTKGVGFLSELEEDKNTAWGSTPNT